MTALEAAGFWIGLNVLFLIFISAQVGRARVKHKVNLGDGGNPDVQRAIRAQGNYTEYAPLALIGLFALSLLGAPPRLIHLLGAVFLGVRVLHYIGLATSIWPRGRFLGILGTVLTLLATAIALFFYAFT